MDNLVLYSLPFSAPCRSVLMLADVMNIKLTIKNVDLMNGEHLKPEYLKKNNHHSVPFLVDELNNLNLFESRAILRYIINQYAEGSSLYPSNAKDRALVDQALDNDGTSIYPAMGAVVYPIVRMNAKVNKEAAKMLDEKLNLLNEDLGRTQYIAGDEMTIADLSLLSTYSSIEATGIWELSHLNNVHAWVQRIKDSKKIKDYDTLVVKNAQTFGDWIKSKIASN